MRKNIHSASSARGFSLVELMIALLIGLIIAIGVVQIFSATRATYQLDESLARAQENGRFALEFLTQDIRHAGYAGCQKNIDPGRLNATDPALAAQTLVGIVGIAGAEFAGTGPGATYPLGPAPANTTSGWLPALGGVQGIPSGVLATAADGALPGSDVLVLQRMVPNSWTLVPPYISPTNIFLHPDFADKVNINDVMLVADCKSPPTAIVVSGITPAGVISHTGDDWTQLGGRLFSYDNIPSSTAFGRMEIIAFYVANDTSSGTNRPTLFRRLISYTGATQTTALVEGVENFQVLYGIDSAPEDGVPERYTTANAVAIADLSKIVSVQIGLLVYGVNATGTANDTEIDTGTYVVAGTNIGAPGDRRSRRAFNTTVQLRNRSF